MKERLKKYLKLIFFIFYDFLFFMIFYCSNVITLSSVGASGVCESS